MKKNIEAPFWIDAFSVYYAKAGHLIVTHFVDDEDSTQFHPHLAKPIHITIR